MTFEDKTKTPKNEGGSLRTERVCGFSFLVVSLAVPDYFQVVGTAQKNRAQRLFCCSRLPCPEETVRVMSSPICPHPVSLNRLSLAFPSPMDQKWRLTAAAATALEEILLVSCDGQSWLQIWLCFQSPRRQPLSFSAEDSLRKGVGSLKQRVCLPLLLPEWVCLHIHWWKCPLLRLSVWAPCSDSPDIIRLPAPAWLLLSFECGSHIAILCFSMCKPRQHPLPVSMYILLVLFTFLSP